MGYMLSLILLALLAHATSISCQNILEQRLNIIILAGQSNMAGRGGVANHSVRGIPTWDGDVPPQCQPNPWIFKLSADMAWVEAREPIHADIDAKKTNGIGPGMAFANAVLSKDPNFGLVGLVPCAIGGTNLSQWQKGGFLYEQLVKRAQMALRSGGAYKAMLWYQGETDTIYKQDVELYQGRLKRFFNDLRSDLQAPRLPIFQVVLASGQGRYTEEVREAQLKIELPNVENVDAMGLPLEPDGLHLTTPAQVRLGDMLAHAFLHFQPNPLNTNHSPPIFVPYFFIIAQVFWMVISFS
ncbi:probable carbohydrate esterase At4g34215 [Gossypium raimondii]|uniref:Sialate O-acetylesterase domain-containing protein n=3 Tax=Gossypium TaxID=3633 RepID=A0A0D2S9B8_GOSRA|nr:probable carbohydrate esterase At4g34215 [Gossypium raimondii]KJB59853.1 hypothetical protein B456_009G276300 [Gossypium raimondii]